MQNETPNICMCNPQPYFSSNNTLAKLRKHFDWRLLSQKRDRKYTVGNKIILAVEIIRGKKFMPNVIL